MQSDDGSVSHDVNNSAPILPFWIAVVIDTPGGILEGVVHKDLHKTVRLIPWQMKVMQQVNRSIDIYGDNIGQHPESRLCYADSAMPCHGMLADSAWSVPGVNLASKKTRQQQVAILSRNSAAGWEHLHRIRSHWSLKGLVCELPLSPQIERFTSDPQALLEARQATLNRSRCKVKELMPCVILCQIPSTSCGCCAAAT